METAYYIEQPKNQTDSDGMEFFLQTSPSHSISTNAHIHDAVELLYIKQGHYTIRLNNKVYSLSPGDLILFHSNAIHHTMTGPEAENSYYVIKINPTFLLKLAPHGHGARYVMRFALNHPEYRCLWTKEELLQNRKILSVLEALIEEHTCGGYGSDLALKLKSAELLLQILRADPPKQADAPGDEVTGRIYEAMVYIREHFSEDIDEKQLSRDFGMSYSYFSRTFRKVTGMSFRQYLNMTRIDHAEQLLLTTQKTVTEAASQCGYNSISYFISVYRKLKGNTPHQTSDKRFYDSV